MKIPDDICKGCKYHVILISMGTKDAVGEGCIAKKDIVYVLDSILQNCELKIKKRKENKK